MTRGPLLLVGTLIALHTALAMVVVMRDPVAVLFATRGLGDPLGTACMAALMVVRIALVFGGPAVFVWALGTAAVQRGGVRGDGRPSDT